MNMPPPLSFLLVLNDSLYTYHIANNLSVNTFLKTLSVYCFKSTETFFSSLTIVLSNSISLTMTSDIYIFYFKLSQESLFPTWQLTLPLKWSNFNHKASMATTWKSQLLFVVLQERFITYLHHLFVHIPLWYFRDNTVIMLHLTWRNFFFCILTKYIKMYIYLRFFATFDTHKYQKVQLKLV